MSTSATLPLSSVDFNGANSLPPQQNVFSNLLGQLSQAILAGSLTQTQTYLNALSAMSPSTMSANDATGTFLNGVATALDHGSIADAQSALATYQGATAANSAASAAPSLGSDTASISAASARMASGLVMGRIQTETVTTLLGSLSSSPAPAPASGINALMNILSEAYPTGSASATSPASPASPYQSLVSAIQANLAAGTSPATTALSYLNSNASRINTIA